MSYAVDIHEIKETFLSLSLRKKITHKKHVLYLSLYLIAFVFHCVIFFYGNPLRPV